jgi:hypothetical protein
MCPSAGVDDSPPVHSASGTSSIAVMSDCRTEAKRCTTSSGGSSRPASTPPTFSARPASAGAHSRSRLQCARCRLLTRQRLQQPVPVIGERRTRSSLGSEITDSGHPALSSLLIRWSVPAGYPGGWEAFSQVVARAAALGQAAWCGYLKVAAVGRGHLDMAGVVIKAGGLVPLDQGAASTGCDRDVCTSPSSRRNRLRGRVARSLGGDGRRGIGGRTRR